MKYLTEFRDPEVAKGPLAEIERTVTRPWVMMEVCGSQTHSIIRNGIDLLLPDEVELVHGPGCPVCVTPLDVIDQALEIASQPDVIFCSFGDLLRVPGSEDLFTVKSPGGDVRVVHSPLDAFSIARDNPDKQVVVFGNGFETTAPANAMAVHRAKTHGLTNFSMLVSHALVPPAIEAILSSPTNRVQALLAAGHVCCVMGYWQYEPIVARWEVPIVVTELQNGLSPGRHPRRNPGAQRMLSEVFQTVDRNWHGIGMIPQSGWELSDAYAEFDAATRFTVDHIRTQESTLCRSGEVLQGNLKLNECEAYGKECAPRTPLGATMVFSEGACAYFTYGRFHQIMGTREARDGARQAQERAPSEVGL